MVSGAVLLHQGLAQAQAKRSARDGVYMAGQATGGEAAYKTNCASCHGDTLEGRGQAPPLAGSEFATGWNELTMADLFERVQVSMPADRPGTLSKDETAGILAYLLKVNNFPAGDKELANDKEALKDIRIDAPAAAR
jgi:polar amino acid transport system substrate-binding protein